MTWPTLLPVWSKPISHADSTARKVPHGDCQHEAQDCGELRFQDCLSSARPADLKQAIVT